MPYSSPRVMPPSTRFAWCFSLGLLFLGPLGFLVGPLLSKSLRARAERKWPMEAAQAKARDVGFGWAAIWIMTVLSLLMAGAAVLFFLPFLAIAIA